MRNALAEERTFNPPERAVSYRAHADAMVKCAAMARTEDERLEYFKLAKAWIALAEGAEHGLKTDQPCADET